MKRPITIKKKETKFGTSLEFLFEFAQITAFEYKSQSNYSKHTYFIQRGHLKMFDTSYFKATIEFDR